MYKVYGMSASGNCHKVRMVLESLHLPYEWSEVDMLNGGTRTPEYLRMNPNGQVPLLEIDPVTHLPESNAIICYLADGTPLVPQDRLQRARMLQWMFFEQYSHEPYIAVARFLRRFHPHSTDKLAIADSKMEGGYRALGVMQSRLAQSPYFAGDRYSLADVALYAYTHVAHEGGFDLARFPAIRDWLARVAAQPGYVSMPSG